MTITIEADGAVFQVSGKTIDFAGFLRAYVEGSDDPEAELADQERSEPTTLNPIADADAYLGPHVVDPEVLRSAHHRSLITAREREERDVRRWIDVDGLRGDLAHVDHR